MKRLLIAIILMLSLPAYADKDEWFGKDKAIHFGVCAGVSLTLTLVGTGAAHSRGALFTLAWDVRKRR